MKKLVLLSLIFAIALCACKKKSEPVAEAPKPVVEVKKEPLSPEKQMQSAVQTAKSQGVETYTDGNKSVKKWVDLNTWEFVSPFQKKYLFTMSYGPSWLLPVGDPNLPGDAQTMFLFEDLKNDEYNIFVPNNAIAWWGTYKDKNGTQYFAYDPAGKELPRRKK